MPLEGYEQVATRLSRVAHLRDPEGGFVCPNGRSLAAGGYPFVPNRELPLCKKCERRAKRPALAAVAGRTPPPWNVEMRRILSDGEWHEIRELARKGGVKIPPNKAMSWFLDHVAPQRSAAWAEALDTRARIRSGRYNLAVRNITEWITLGVVEADRPPRRKGRRVRLTERSSGPPRAADGRYSRPRDH